MNEEFAIEPTALKDPEKEVRYVLEKFGFSEARFISALPGKWVKEVYSQLEELPDGPSKRMAIESLNKTKARGGIVRSGVDFHTMESWLENAATCGKKFEGILVSRETDKKNYKCKSIEEIDKSFFGSRRDEKLSATIENYGRVATRLLDFSHEIYLIDPYFNFSSEECMDVLKEFVDIGSKGRCKNFVIYTSARVQESKGVDVILYKNFINNKASFKVLHVGPDAKDFHDRYLLSKFGGILLGKGFRRKKNELHNFRAIDSSFHEELCRTYIDEDYDFDIQHTNYFPN